MFLFIGKFKNASPGHSYLVADESLLSFNGYMTQEAVISESLSTVNRGCIQVSDFKREVSLNIWEKGGSVHQKRDIQYKSYIRFCQIWGDLPQLFPKFGGRLLIWGESLIPRSIQPQKIVSVYGLPSGPWTDDLWPFSPLFWHTVLTHMGWPKHAVTLATSQYHFDISSTLHALNYCMVT